MARDTFGNNLETISSFAVFVSKQCSFALDVKSMGIERMRRYMNAIKDQPDQLQQDQLFSHSDGNCWPMLRPAVRLGTMYVMY